MDFGAHNEALFSRPVWLDQEKKGEEGRCVPGTRFSVDLVLIRPALNLQVKNRHEDTPKRPNKNAYISNRKKSDKSSSTISSSLSKPCWGLAIRTAWTADRSKSGPFPAHVFGWAEISSQPWLCLPVPPSLCGWKSELLRKKSECILHKSEFVSGLEHIVTRSCLRSQTSWRAALLGIIHQWWARWAHLIHAALPRSLCRLTLKSTVTSDGLR